VESRRTGLAWKAVEEYEADLEHRLAAADARVVAEMAQAEKDRAERKARYDPEQAQARSALLEAGHAGQQGQR